MRGAPGYLARRRLRFRAEHYRQNACFRLSKAKAALDAAIVKARADAAAKLNGKPEALAEWRTHDLRRSGVSTLARLGFDSIVADKILGHQPAKLLGVAAIQQRHDFAHERAAALDAWAAHVTRERIDNVLPLARAIV